MNFNEHNTQKMKDAFAQKNIEKKGTILTIRKTSFFLFILILFTISFGFAIGFVQALYHRTPTVTVDSLRPEGKPSVIYDSNGNKVISITDTYYTQIPVSIDDVPQDVQDAVVAAIDPTFYNHNGVTVYSLLNTLTSTFLRQNNYGECNLITEKLIEGLDSDLTLGNNWIGRLEYHMDIHFKSISLERNSTKSQILEMYLNYASFGNGIVGIEAASEYYYGKKVDKLSLSEAAMLATIVADPDENNPYDNPDNASAEYQTTLNVMLDQAFITNSAWNKASLTDPYEHMKTYSDATMLSAFNQAMLNNLCQEMKEEYQIDNTKFQTLMAYGNLKIYTTQDTTLQKKAQEIIDTDYYYSYNAKAAEASLTIMDQHTGQVKAVIGGKDGKTATLNRATEQTQQPGSLFQILATYAPGIDTGTLTLASVYEDAPYQYLDNKREVKSVDGVYDGLTTIRSAIGQRMNLVAARAQSDVTSSTSFDYLNNFGFKHIVETSVDSSGNIITDVQQSICNGNLINGVTNLEITEAFGTLGNKGVHASPVFYTEITDKAGAIILENHTDTSRVLSSSTAFLVSDALKDQGKDISDQVDVAEISGNNEDNTDFWCTGYSSDLTMTLWLGYDDNRSFENINSARRVWELIMKEVVSGSDSSSFEEPLSIETADICQKSGLLAVPGICDKDQEGDQILTEYFAKGTVPTRTCDTHVAVTICPASGMLINNNCPKEDYLQMVYLVLPKGDENTTDAKYALPDKYKNGERCNIHN